MAMDTRPAQIGQASNGTRWTVRSDFATLHALTRSKPPPVCWDERSKFGLCEMVIFGAKSDLGFYGGNRTKNSFHREN